MNTHYENKSTTTNDLWVMQRDKLRSQLDAEERRANDLIVENVRLVNVVAELREKIQVLDMALAEANATLAQK
jgi:hypothetical protein